MNKDDQKYLLNSEILVIVQHMMMKRKKDLDRRLSEKLSESEDDDELGGWSRQLYLNKLKYMKLLAGLCTLFFLCGLRRHW